MLVFPFSSTYPLYTRSHPVECTACEFVVGEIEKLLANNSTQQEIIMELEKVCVSCSSFCSHAR